MADARSIIGDVIFTVSESANGTPWISLKPRSPVPELEKLVVGFDLPANVDVDRAAGVARYLNATLGSLRLTFIDGVSIR